MPRSRPPYPPEYRARIVELARSVASLAKEFGVTDNSIRNWLRQADLDTGRRVDGRTTEEKQELTRLRREVARLREERDILEKVAAWFAQESATQAAFRFVRAVHGTRRGQWGVDMVMSV